MKCIKVYPILKRSFSDSLTYWINEDVCIGDIIEAPLQNRKIWVVVDSIISVNEAKEFIKSQDFKIRKIDTIKKLELFSLDFIFSVLKTSNYYIKPFGEVFSELIPKKILENLSNDIIISKNESQDINVFPIKEYMSGSPDLVNKILPIDLWKIDSPTIEIINLYYPESEYYRHLLKKFDYRYFIKEFCSRRKIKLIEVDTKLDLQNKNLYIINQSSKNKASIKKKNLLNEIYKEKLNIISPELFSALKKIEKNKESILLYTLKKGFASTVMCSDCGHILKCDECDENLGIDFKGEKYVYKCVNQHKNVSIDTPCPICKNENLTTLGASIEVIYKEIKKEFDIDIVKIDKDSHTKSQIKNTLKEFEGKNKPVIFIANDFLINQSIGLNFKFDNIAIVSLESLFSIPLYGMENDIYNKIALISNTVSKNLIIQTRNIENPFWKDLETNNINKIKTLNLPPYTTHIQISIPTEKNKKVLNIIKDYLDHQLEYSEITKKTKTIIHIIMDKKEYLKNPIIYYLKSLPSYIKIEVDSRNLL